MSVVHSLHRKLLGRFCLRYPPKKGGRRPLQFPGPSSFIQLSGNPGANLADPSMVGIEGQLLDETAYLTKISAHSPLYGKVIPRMGTSILEDNIAGT